MPKRNTVQRRQGILQCLQQQGEVQVEALARQFETSEVTIRKDLATLEKSGMLLRRYGGAVPLPRELLPEQSADAGGKAELSLRKQAIAGRRLTACATITASSSILAAPQPH